MDYSKEYQEALEANNEAIRKFKSIQAAYRAQQITDKQFLSGMKDYGAAMKAFDKAIEKESNRF